MMMRVPDRFLLQPSHAAGIDLVLAHHPELQRFVARTTATPAGQCFTVHSQLASDAHRLSCLVDSKVPAHFPRRQLSLVSDGPTLVGETDVSEADAGLLSVEEGAEEEEARTDMMASKTSSDFAKSSSNFSNTSSGCGNASSNFKDSSFLKVDGSCSPLRTSMAVCSAAGKRTPEPQDVSVSDQAGEPQKDVKLHQLSTSGAESVGQCVSDHHDDDLHTSAVDVKFIPGRVLHPLSFELCKSECDTVSMSSGSTMSLEFPDIYHKVSLSPNESLV